MTAAALALALALLSQAPVTRWADASEAERARLVLEDAALPLESRVLRVSERFLDAPYLPSPLGEGHGIDPDPVFRIDAVDCLTFVEASLALSLARGFDSVTLLLSALRYHGAPEYTRRNHLMEAQWLPNNLRKGFLADVTRRYGGRDVVMAHKKLTATTWQSLSSAALRLPLAHQPKGTFSLPMIPLEKVMVHAPRFPSGTILVVLREDLPLKPTRITHLGFVVQKKRRTYLRHAARGTYGRVVDEDLATFLLRNAKYSKWKVTGVALYAPRQPSLDAVVRSP